MEKATTTIMIYSEDHKILTELCKKGENYRDRFHQIIKGEQHGESNSPDASNSK